MGNARGAELRRCVLVWNHWFLRVLQSVFAISSRARRTLRSDPYEFAYTMVMILIAGRASDELREPETIAFLCDEHDRAIHVQQSYEKLKESNPRCADWMGSLTYMDNKRSVALQAADLIAGRGKDFTLHWIKCEGNAEKLAQVKETHKAIMGRNVGFWKMDSKSLKLVVDANLLKNGKPSIYSTHRKLFDDLTDLK